MHERKNWLIHLHYIRKEYDRCKVSGGIFYFKMSRCNELTIKKILVFSSLHVILNWF